MFGMGHRRRVQASRVDKNTLEHSGSSGSEMPAWVKPMKESPTLVMLDTEEVERLDAMLGHLGSIRFPRVQRLVNHVSEEFLFLDGPDCSHLPGEIAKLGKVKDPLGKKLDEIRRIAWPSPYSLRFVVAKRVQKSRPLSLSIFEMVPDGPSSGLNEDAQEDLAGALGSFTREFRYLSEMKPATGYPEPDVILDAEKTIQLVGEIELLLSESNKNRSRVTPGLVRQLQGILPVLHHAMDEGLYVWLSRA